MLKDIIKVLGKIWIKTYIFERLDRHTSVDHIYCSRLLWYYDVPCTPWLGGFSQTSVSTNKEWATGQSSVGLLYSGTLSLRLQSITCSRACSRHLATAALHQSQDSPEPSHRPLECGHWLGLTGAIQWISYGPGPAVNLFWPQWPVLRHTATDPGSGSIISDGP